MSHTFPSDCFGFRSLQVLCCLGPARGAYFGTHLVIQAALVWEVAEGERASERSTQKEHWLAFSRGSRDLLASLVTFLVLESVGVHPPSGPG